MDYPISIFNNINDNVIVSLKKFKLINYTKYYIAIIPSTGAWCYISFEDEKRLNILKSPKTVAEIRSIDDAGLWKLIDSLFYSRILKLDGKDAEMINNHYKEHTYPLVSHFWVLKYTNICNLKCSYCYSFKDKVRQRIDLPNQYVYKISDLIGNEKREKLNICFHGGEPLTRFNDIVECVKVLREKRGENVEFTIQTNGTLITKKIAKFLKKEDFGVGISIDGYNESTNSLRAFANGRNSFESTLKSIKICKSAGFVPAILSVMTNTNGKSAVETIGYYARLGVKAFHFIHFIPSGRAENKVNDYSVPITELIEIRKKMLIFINDWNKGKDAKEHIYERYSRNIIRSLINACKIDYMCGQSPCGAGMRILAITPNGDIYPCDDFCYNSDFIIGNIEKIVNLKKTIRNSKSVRLCQSHQINAIKECRECIWKKICISHCCSDSFHYTGKLYSPHSACDFIKRFIPIVIDLLHEDRIQVENLIE